MVSSILLQLSKINSCFAKQTLVLQNRLMCFLIIFLSVEFDDSPVNLDDVKENHSRKRHVTIHFVCGRDSYTRPMLYPITIQHIFYICFLGVVFF